MSDETKGLFDERGEQGVTTKLTPRQAALLADLEQFEDFSNVGEWIRCRTLYEISVAVPPPHFPEQIKRTVRREIMRKGYDSAVGTGDWRIIPIGVIVDLPRETVERFEPKGMVERVKSSTKPTPYAEYAQIKEDLRHERRLIAHLKFLKENTDQEKFRLEIPLVEGELEKYRVKDKAFPTGFRSEVKKNIPYFRDRLAGMRAEACPDDPRIMEQVEKGFLKRFGGK